MAKFNRKSWNYYEKPKFNIPTNKRKSFNINTAHIRSYEDIYNNSNDKKILKISCKTTNPEIYQAILTDLQDLIIRNNGTKCEMKPINPIFNDGLMEFYVNLSKSNFKIAMRVYSQMNYDIKFMDFSDYHVPSHFPIHWIDMIKESLKLRFSIENGVTCLDLSNFSNDKYLNGKGLILRFNSGRVMENIEKILKPELHAVTKLNLSSNRLYNLYKFKTFLKEVNIQKLDLSNNRIKVLTDLKLLEGSTISELDLRDNEVSNILKFQRLKDGIRDFLPHLKILNGKKLDEPVIIAGGSNSTSTPTTKQLPASIKINDPNSPVVKFLTTYFLNFDKKTKDFVCDYYTTESCFTISTYGEIPHFYKSNSCNFQLLRQQERRKANRKEGKVQIMSLLADFPLTKHLFETFNVDVIASEDNFMSVKISGIYIELPLNKSGAYRPREFGRWFIIKEGGIILQDHIDIMPNDHQLYMKYKIKISELREIDEFLVSYPEVEQQFEGKSLSTEEISYIKKIKEYTKMKISPCLDLLRSSSNYDDAINKFNQMNIEGKIPPDVFDK